MLEMLVNKKLLFVLMGIFAGVGVVDKCIVGMGLKRLVQAAGDMSKSTHPLMRLVRAKFEHACMVSDTVENVGVFVDKYLYEYKICGLPLHTVRRMEKVCAGLCALTGLTGAFLTYRMYGMGDAVLRMGASGVGLGILVWLIHLTTDEEYSVQMAKNYMVDYLENVCLHKYEKANGKVSGKERTGRLRLTGSDAVRQMQNAESDMEYAGENEITAMTEAVETMAPVETMTLAESIAQEETMAPAESGRKTTRTRSGRRKSEPTREVARNLERATAKLAEATRSGRAYAEYEEYESEEETQAQPVQSTTKSTARSQAKTTENPQTKSTAQTQTRTEVQSQTNAAAQTYNEENASDIPEEIRKELPKEEMIRQILQEFMA